MKKRLTTKQLFAEIAGWYGAVAILFAYALSSFHIISVDGIAYQLLNLTGAIGVIIIAWHKRVAQSVVLNAVWGTVAVIAIIAILV